MENWGRGSGHSRLTRLKFQWLCSRVAIPHSIRLEWTGIAPLKETPVHAGAANVDGLRIRDAFAGGKNLCRETSFFRPYCHATCAGKSQSNRTGLGWPPRTPTLRRLLVRCLHLIDGMECKKCNAKISGFVAVESKRNIAILCEATGMSPADAQVVAGQRGPLCRKCMEHWGTGEENIRG